MGADGAQRRRCGAWGSMVDGRLPRWFDRGMGLTLKESNAARGLAECLADFLPGSGAKAWKGHVTFGTVAERAGVREFWAASGSKTPRIAHLLEATLQHRRDRFEPLILGIVREGLLYRRRSGQPISPQEIEKINGLILEIGFRFPDLWDRGFQAALSTDDAARARQHVAAAQRDDEARTTERQRRLRSLDQLRDDFGTLHALTNRQEAGFRLEALLNSLFQLAGLTPREPFRVVGEQIDGSFELDHEVYLVEAKWEADALPEAPLLIFRGKIEGKSAFTRGVLIALNGISEPGREAITRGKQPNFFAVDGYDIMMVLQRAIELPDFLRRRQRLLAEEGLVVAPFDRARAVK